MSAEPVSRTAAYPSLTIEEGPDFLRCEAKPSPLWPTLFVGVGVTALAALPLAMAARPFFGRARSAGFATDLDLAIVVLCTALVVAAVGVFAVAVRRSRRPRRLTIEDDELVLLTPEQPVVENRCETHNVKAARLRGGSGGGDGPATLVVVRKRGAAIAAFSGLPADDLSHVVDAVNRFVRVEDYHAFEVVVGNVPNAAPRPVILIGAGEPLPPLAVLPVEPSAAARDRDAPVDH
jgi:hypothetical protein